MALPDALQQLGGQPQEFKIKPPEPITVLIPPEKAPAETLKLVEVKEGGLSVETPQGTIGVELYAFPAPEGETQIPFLQRVLLRKKAEQPSPVQVAVEPTVQYDYFKKGEHTPLMGWYPHAVLQEGTRYGVVVTAPSGIAQQDWSEQKERTRTMGGLISLPATVWEDGVEYEVREIYKERKGLAVAVRVDGKHPLAQRQEKGYTGGIINREMLIGGFRPAQRHKGLVYTVAAQRVTEMAKNGKNVPNVGEEVEAKATAEDLIFALVSEEGAEAPEKEKGVVEVIVYEATEDEVTEVIKTPKPKVELWQPASDWDLTRNVTLGGEMKSFGSRSFQTGETKFGKPKREKVTISGVKDLKPIAAFRMVLVGENVAEGLEMKEAQSEVVEPSEPTEPTK